MLTSTQWDRLLRPDLTGKVALVTGAASGMGASTASAFVHLGASVALVDRNADGLKAVQAEIEAAGGNAITIPADLSDPAAPAAVVEETVARLGGLNILLSSAGIFGTHPIQDFPLEAYDAHQNINLRAPFLLVKAAYPHLSAGDSVILISSGTAVMPSPYGTAYAASKGGVISLTRALSAELAPLGVRVNSISPGFTETAMVAEILDTDGLRETVQDMTPNRRIGQPEDIAATAVFLVSPGAVQIVGENIAVDGGITKTAPTPPARND
jgi:NAD(P)-dependent dehydrogenase (short-subunit alcohol dehydrogenase family)